MVEQETGEVALDPKHLDKAFMKKQAKEAEAAEKVVDEADKVVGSATQKDIFVPTQLERSILEEVDDDDEKDLENDGNFAETYNLIQGRDKANKPVAKTDKANKIVADEKSKTICPHMIRGRCNHGLTGKKKHLENDTCPFFHPRVCQKVLDHGLWGPRGCKEKSREGHFHPRMCRASMSQQGCPTKDCKLGYHMKRRKEEVVAREIPGLKAKKNSQMMEKEKEEAGNSWNCDKCPMVSKSKKELEDHISNVHNVKCPHCTKKFHYLEHLDKHIEESHGSWGQQRRAGGQSSPRLNAGGSGNVAQFPLQAGVPTDMSAFLDRLMQMQQQQNQHTQLLQQMMSQMQARTAEQAVIQAHGQQQFRLPVLGFQ